MRFCVAWRSVAKQHLVVSLPRDRSLSRFRSLVRHNLFARLPVSAVWVASDIRTAPGLSSFLEHHPLHFGFWFSVAFSKMTPNVKSPQNGTNMLDGQGGYRGAVIVIVINEILTRK